MSSLVDIIASLGYVGVTVIVFAESGFLLGFFLPGDSLLITVGLLASKQIMNIWILLALVIAAAILGDNFGYYTGRKLGPKIFSKEESLFFKKEYIVRTAVFFKKYGWWAIVLARFVPIVRTFTPIMAGVGSMHYRTFLLFNVIGGVLWGGGLLTLSFIAGLYIPGFEKYIEYIVVGIILVSLIPVARQFIKR